MRFLASMLVFSLGIVLFAISFVARADASKPATESVSIPHVDFSKPFHVTSGAAAGYVEDKVCATCHTQKYIGYQEIGMSQSFKKPAKRHFIEDFNAKPFYHAPSKRYYQVKQQGDDLTFVRYQKDTNGHVINLFERKIDYIIGSGNKTRSYLYQTEVGELFMLPLSWYSDTQQWEMSPGFEKADHIGVSRQITRECMFCHNALPEVPTDSDWHWQPQVFPHELPEGTGCQRCHGPGANHVSTVLSGNASLDDIHNAIINPAKLEPKLRDSVCFQCHMLPSVAMTGPRRFERPEYSFRPGQYINDYLLHIDITDANVAPEDRFEINHHAYRFTQSTCYIESEGELGCINCHDVHKKVPDEQRASYFKAKCLSCHEEAHPVLENQAAPLDDCVSCHMPQRRTQDVIHVTMTDHKIGIHANVDKLTAPVTKLEPVIEAMNWLFDNDLSASKQKVYKAATLTRNLPTDNYLNALQGELLSSNLIAEDKAQVQPYFDLIEGRLKLGQYAQAENAIKYVLSQNIRNFRLQQWLAMAYVGQNKLTEAKPLLDSLMQQVDNVPDIPLYYGFLLVKQGKNAQALSAFQQACDIRPVMVTCWYYQGVMNEALGDLTGAVDAFKQTLSVDPSVANAYLKLANILVNQNNHSEAKRYLQHGIEQVADNTRLKQALQSL